MFRQRRILRDYGPQPLLFLVGKQTVTRPLGIICHQVSGVVPSPEAELLRNPAPGVPLVAGKSSLVVAMLFFGCYALGFQCQCGGFLLPQLLGQLCLFLSQIENRICRAFLPTEILFDEIHAENEHPSFQSIECASALDDGAICKFHLKRAPLWQFQPEGTCPKAAEHPSESRFPRTRRSDCTVEGQEARPMTQSCETRQGSCGARCGAELGGIGRAACRESVGIS